jgi:hypothetical protein
MNEVLKSHENLPSSELPFGRTTVDPALNMKAYDVFIPMAGNSKGLSCKVIPVRTSPLRSGALTRPKAFLSFVACLASTGPGRMRHMNPSRQRRLRSLSTEWLIL